MISPGSYNRRVGLTVCPITSQVKGYPFEVLLPSGLGVGGAAVLSDQIKSLDWRVRKARRIATVPVEVLDETVGKIRALIDPDDAR